ncbi:MAG: hypothetical protein M0R70_12335 [Nitrospirae bacterium]|nr:hypothetical protein [Nitrospirota bacterium]
MMKKIVTMLAVVAMVCVSSMAFAVDVNVGGDGSGLEPRVGARSISHAVDVTVGGSVDIRSRNFRDLDLNKNAGDGQVDTQERVRLDVNVKAGDVKGKITIENDWDTLGRFETVQGTTTVATGATNTTTGAVSTGKASRLGVREAWMLFRVPNMPFAIKGGHMFLQLGNGWWFRSNKYGSDAWVAISELDKLHLALFDVKVSEGVTSRSDDIDAYGIVATLQATETMKFGVDLTMANDRKNGLGFGGASTKETQAQNLGLNFNGKAGPVDLKAEIDVQMGKAKGNDAKFKGNQIVVQGGVQLEPVTINFTVARGSGAKTTDTDYKEMITFLDADPHYTLLYEYKIGNPSCASPSNPTGLNTGFCNTTALSGGAMFAATKNLSIGGDLWILQATEKVADVTSTTGGTTNELGMEVDVKINWKLYDNLTWNWTLGYLDPGKGLGKDPATGAQGVLSMKF